MWLWRPRCVRERGVWGRIHQERALEFQVRSRCFSCSNERIIIIALSESRELNKRYKFGHITVVVVLTAVEYNASTCDGRCCFVHLPSVCDTLGERPESADRLSRC